MSEHQFLDSLDQIKSGSKIFIYGAGTFGRNFMKPSVSLSLTQRAAPATTWENKEDITFHSDEPWKEEIREVFSAIKEKRNMYIGHSGDALKFMRIIGDTYSFRKDVGRG